MSERKAERQRGLADIASRETFKRAVFQIVGSDEPTNAELRELGRDAAQAVGRARPWGHSHLYSLIHFERYPKYRLNVELFEYVTRRAGLYPLQGSHKVTVATRAKIRAGALVLVGSRRCARQRCGLHFVPAAANQKYCSPECQARVAAWRRKRAKRRAARHAKP